MKTLGVIRPFFQSFHSLAYSISRDNTHISFETLVLSQSILRTIVNMELTWSHDYCLACDRQTSGGAYCSQSCRLADHESSSNWADMLSSPAGPSTEHSNSTADPSSGLSHGSGFYISPSHRFEVYKQSNGAVAPAKAEGSQEKPTSGAPLQTLSPSSSRSSLASTASSNSSHGNFTAQVHNELRAYTNSFDTTRNWRRRRTWS